MGLAVNQEQLQQIICEYAISGEITKADELLRYDYQKNDETSREIRLILKAYFDKRQPIVIKLKNEIGVTSEIIEQQTIFSQHLLHSGITTPRYYTSNNRFVLAQNISDYDVFITVEDFVDDEVKTVDPDISYKTGVMLANTHNISERDNCHVNSRVIFDPFSENDLFSSEVFLTFNGALNGENLQHFERINRQYQHYMCDLNKISLRPKYAVQGDISDCNLYVTSRGEIGLFDYNRCGDSILFCDAIMQGVFQARLMDYECEVTESFTDKLLSEFLTGYNKIRPFSHEELNAIPILYSVIAAFWSSQIIYDDDSMKNLIEKGDKQSVTDLLHKIEKQIMSLKKITCYDEKIIVE